jgi:hypothetical protein
MVFHPPTYPIAPRTTWAHLHQVATANAAIIQRNHRAPSRQGLARFGAHLLQWGHSDAHIVFLILVIAVLTYGGWRYRTPNA